MATKQLKVVQQEGEEPIAAEILAQAIVSIDKGIKAINRSGLKRKAIVLLISRSASVTQRDTENVLDAMDGLRKEYTTL